MTCPIRSGTVITTLTYQGGRLRRNMPIAQAAARPWRTPASRAPLPRRPSDWIGCRYRDRPKGPMTGRRTVAQVRVMGDDADEVTAVMEALLPLVRA